MRVTSHIEHGAMTRFQIACIAICVLINMLDGFDVLVVAFTAPAISAEWDLSGTAIGTLLSAGLVGMTLGSLVLGPLADRFGRRPLVLCCLAVITAGMLLSSATQNTAQLTAMRLLTGLGIGGMLPSLNTMVSELSSLKWRSFSVTVLQTGYPVGATLGGVLAAMLIVQFGWRAVYVAAGCASLAMMFIVWRVLPESLDYLLSRRPGNALPRINDLLRKLGQTELTELPAPVHSGAVGKTGYAGLFGDAALRRRTLLLCLSFFIVMLSFYFVLSWTPQILVDSGLSTSEGISGGVLLNVGGVVGSLLLGYIAARIPISLLIAVYMALTAGLMVWFSTVNTFDAFMLTLTLALGFFIFGSMVGLYALAPHLYPVNSRAAGLSAAIGVGRIGAVLAPALAGYLFDHGWKQSDGYIVFAAPLLVSVVAVLLLGSWHAPGKQRPDPAPDA